MEEERGELEHVCMLMCTYMYVCKGFAPPFNKILFNSKVYYLCPGCEKVHWGKYRRKLYVSFF